MENSSRNVEAMLRFLSP